MGNNYVPTSAKRRPHTITGTDARMSILLPEDDKAALDRIITLCQAIAPAVNLSCFVRTALLHYVHHLSIFNSANEDLDSSMLRAEIRKMVSGTYADGQ